MLQSTELKYVIDNLIYTSIHNHTEYSNIRLLDSTNKYDKMIQRALDIGYGGMAITDHEILACLPNAYWYLEDLKKNNPDNKAIQNFKLIFGNEVYCVNDLRETKRDYKQYKNGFYHLILLAKDMTGYEQLKVLSQKAWNNTYASRKMTRVPLEVDALKEVVSKDKGHLICSSACLGSYLDKILLQKMYYEQQMTKIKKYLKEINKIPKPTMEKYAKDYKEMVAGYNGVMEDLDQYFELYLELFGDDFYLELQPSNSADQVYVNKELVAIGKKLNVKWIVTTDSHYLSKDQQKIHTAYLNSKGGDRETATFYATTYMMEIEEIYNYLVNNDISHEDAIAALMNTKEIYDKCTSEYHLEKGFQIPKIDVDDKLEELKKKREIQELIKQTDKKYQGIFDFINSENTQEQYYIYSCLDGVLTREIEYNDRVKDRISRECTELIEISKQLGGNLSQYYISVQKIIEIMWDKGNSIVGAGRGCLSKDTNVLTPSGFKKINELSVGDEVFDQNGDITKITEVFEYDCNEELIEIKGYHGGQGNKMTFDHKVLTISDVDINNNQSNNKTNWKQAKDITKNDWVVFPKIKKSTLCNKLNYILNQNTCKADEKFIYIKVKEINICPPEGKVYDFTVPTTHSYVTDSYIVHNSVGCWFTAYLMYITETSALKFDLPSWRLNLINFPILKSIANNFMNLITQGCIFIYKYANRRSLSQI